MNIIIADLYVEEKDMDRPWNSLQKNPVQVAEVVLPQVGDVTRTKMNCLGRIAAL